MKINTCKFLTTIPTRFDWAVDVMNIKSNDRVLEIGCGAGLLAEQILKKLKEGFLTAIDRSGPMIEKAIKRNELSIKDHRSEFLQSSFSQFSPVKKYDKIVAFNVNFFQKGGEELNIVRLHLAPGGKLFLFYQAPYEITTEAAEPIRVHLEKHLYKVDSIQLKKLHPYSAICVAARSE